MNYELDQTWLRLNTVVGQVSELIDTVNIALAALGGCFEPLQRLLDSIRYIMSLLRLVHDGLAELQAARRAARARSRG